MKRYNYLLVFFLVTYLTVYPQQRNIDSLTKIAFSKAKIMSNAFLEKDYDTFLSFLPKKIIDLSGGKDSLKATYEKGIAPNVTMVKSEFYYPHQSLSYKNSFQCVMKYKQFISINGQMIYVTTYLIGIYKYEKKSWEFIGAVNNSIEQLQNFEPILSPNLKIEKQTKPIWIF